MLTIAIGSFSMAYYIVNIVMPANFIKKTLKIHHTRRLKPIDCVNCLTVWIAVAMWLIPFHWAQFLAVIFTAGFISTRFK